jgi:hypothetical protein
VDGPLAAGSKGREHRGVPEDPEPPVAVRALALPTLTLDGGRPARGRWPRVSPDGKRIAVRLDAGRGGLWIGEPGRPAVRLLADGQGRARWPVGWLDKDAVLFADVDEEGQPIAIGLALADGSAGVVEIPARAAIAVGRGMALVSAPGQLVRWEPKRLRSTVVAPLGDGLWAESLAASTDGNHFACAETAPDGVTLLAGEIAPRPGARRITVQFPAGSRIAPAYAGETLLALIATADRTRLVTFDPAGHLAELLDDTYRGYRPTADDEAAPVPQERLAASPDGKRVAMLRETPGLRLRPGQAAPLELRMVDLAAKKTETLLENLDLRGELSWREPLRLRVEGPDLAWEIVLAAPEPPRKKPLPRRAPKPPPKPGGKS